MVRTLIICSAKLQKEYEQILQIPPIKDNDVEYTLGGQENANTVKEYSKLLFQSEHYKVLFQTY